MYCFYILWRATRPFLNLLLPLDISCVISLDILIRPPPWRETAEYFSCCWLYCLIVVCLFARWCSYGVGCWLIGLELSSTQPLKRIQFKSTQPNLSTQLLTAIGPIIQLHTFIHTHQPWHNDHMNGWIASWNRSRMTRRMRRRSTEHMSDLQVPFQQRIQLIDGVIHLYRHNILYTAMVTSQLQS